MAHRFLVLCATVVLAVAMALAGAGSAIAAVPTHAGRDAGAVHGGGAATARPAPAEAPASDDAGSSSIVPLVFAGIVILAAAGPWVPPRSRSSFYWIDRW
jgi:hypothetical protein